MSQPKRPVGVTDRPAWWAAGLPLHERLPRPEQLPCETAATERLERWRSAHDMPDQGWFVRRLAETGLDECGLTGLLSEPPEALAARVDRPSWADFVSRALRLPVQRSPATDGWLEALATGLRPLVDAAAAEVADLGGTAITGGFADQLDRRLVRLAARTLVLELNRARVRGELTGRTPSERFADFVSGLNLQALFAEYPVLARLVGQTCQYAVQAHRELLTRLATDRDLIVATLLDGRDPGDLASISTDNGDAHRHGRSVAILTFADGRQVVYKPRPLDLHEHFNEVVAWLNGRVPGLGMRTVELINRDGYGWLEFIQHEQCPEVSGISRFYRRQGALLALLYAVDGTDMHYENLIACGDQPVLIDVETLFHPTLPTETLTGFDPASFALACSVHRAALLPQALLGDNGALDISGLGGDRGGQYPIDGIGWEGAGTDTMRLIRQPVDVPGSQNRPRIGGHEAEPGDYQAALLTGFQAAYDAIVEHRRELVEILRRCADDEVRYISRPTQLYATLLDESTHPDALRDALDRDRVFDLLWTDSLDDPMRRQLVPHEIGDLWEGDVPLFTCRPGSTDVWAADGSRLPGLLAVTGLTAVEQKLAAMGEVDRHTQEWLITASFATRPREISHRGAETLPGEVTAVVPDPQRLLTAACGIADEIVGRAVPGDGRVNWLSLELVDDRFWSVMPMGAGLANGYSGLALFLAQLAALTGAPRYTDLAREAIRPIPLLLDAFTGNTELLGVVGSGGFHGLGGICYSLARLSSLLGDDQEIGQWLRAAVDLAVDLEADVPEDEPADLAEGLAGGLAAMLAVYAETGLPAAGTLAIRYADRLATGAHPATEATGFARGPAGVGWALLRLASAIGSDRHAMAGYAALGLDADLADRLDGPVDHGWCTGVSGAVLARTGHGDDLNRPRLATDITRCVDAVSAHKPLRDLSLCHGELGVLEALTVLAERGNTHAAMAKNRRTGLVLGSLEQYGVRCGTPDGVPSPGLLSGLAGIGYGLLRLGFADRVPSVLLLDTKTN